jgi:hypothetical protein
VRGVGATVGLDVLEVVVEPRLDEGRGDGVEPGLRGVEPGLRGVDPVAPGVEPATLDAALGKRGVADAPVVDGGRVVGLVGGGVGPASADGSAKSPSYLLLRAAMRASKDSVLATDSGAPSEKFRDSLTCTSSHVVELR